MMCFLYFKPPNMMMPPVGGFPVMPGMYGMRPYSGGVMVSDFRVDKGRCTYLVAMCGGGDGMGREGNLWTCIKRSQIVTLYYT